MYYVFIICKVDMKYSFLFYYIDELDCVCRFMEFLGRNVGYILESSMLWIGIRIEMLFILKIWGYCFFRNWMIFLIKGVFYWEVRKEWNDFFLFRIKVYFLMFVMFGFFSAVIILNSCGYNGIVFDLVFFIVKCLKKKKNIEWMGGY